MIRNIVVIDVEPGADPASVHALIDQALCTAGDGLLDYEIDSSRLIRLDAEVKGKVHAALFDCLGEGGGLMRGQRDGATRKIINALVGPRHV